MTCVRETMLEHGARHDDTRAASSGAGRGREARDVDRGVVREAHAIQRVLLPVEAHLDRHIGNLKQRLACQRQVVQPVVVSRQPVAGCECEPPRGARRKPIHRNVAAVRDCVALDDQPGGRVGGLVADAQRHPSMPMPARLQRQPHYQQVVIQDRERRQRLLLL